jgi:DNA-binding NtrC family response regulator
MQDMLAKLVRPNILIVESDRVIARHLCKVIGNISSGYHIQVAKSGMEGLQRVEQDVVNIVLAAEKLVDMSGKTFIAILQGMRSLNAKEPACVLMSEKCQQLKKQRDECPDCVAIIQSPVDRNELAYTLDRALDWDGLNWKIGFNEVAWKVLMVLVPVAVLVGVMIRGPWS